MSKIGILFDIDELESGLYGYAAYKIFFAAVDSRQIAGCTLSDGDTNSTLTGTANQYCIAVDTPHQSTITTIKESLSKVDTKGLCPLQSRFLEGALVSREPLVLSTRITSDGELANCSTGWIMAAWKETKKKGD